MNPIIWLVLAVAVVATIYLVWRVRKQGKDAVLTALGLLGAEIVAGFVAFFQSGGAPGS